MGPGSTILTQGSCFSEAIGERLKINKMPACVNPFGVIYNPESIHKALSYAVFNEPPPDHTFVHQNEVFLNYNVHSQLSASTREGLVSRLTETIGSSHYFLKDAGWLIITYGTAWVYTRNDTGEIVANCHKLPAALFTKSLMSVQEVVNSFTRFFDDLKRFNPGVRVILTVSPVRHLRDTMELNSVSKAVLRLACHEIAANFEEVEYFPAFEIMMDDLRDYRFYKSDLLHPTIDAEDYIWEKFMERYFSQSLREFVQTWQTILSAMHHKPFHPLSNAHQQFLRETLKKVEALKGVADVEEEIAQLKQQIRN